MLKYLIILLESSSPSFCHYSVNNSGEKRLMSLSHLQKAVRFAMLENLNVQFVWPEYMLDDDYLRVIDSVDHINIASARLTHQADVIVSDSFDTLSSIEPFQNVIIRCKLMELVANFENIIELQDNSAHISVVFSDLPSWTKADLGEYKKILSKISDRIAERFLNGKRPQLSLLTDRLFLRKMNNCSAGVESLTIGPDGYFYVCPAFYYFNHPDSKLGSLDDTLVIHNSQLYQIDHAPICSNCDAWHCHRCIWLNKYLTREVNTPGKIQCEVAHLEREASRQLKDKLASKNFDVSAFSDIPELSYIDPFENRKLWM